MGIALAGTAWSGTLQVTGARSERRLAGSCGDQFRRAIGQYYERSPGGDSVSPDRLMIYCSNKRYPATQRLLASRLSDPITGTAWGFVKGRGPDRRRLQPL